MKGKMTVDQLGRPMLALALNARAAMVVTARPERIRGGLVVTARPAPIAAGSTLAR